MREKIIKCHWEWSGSPQHETIFLSDSMHIMEREVHGQEIVFEGNELTYGNTYTIAIRDAEAKVKLKGTFCNSRLLQKYCKNAKGATERHSTLNNSTFNEPILMISSRSWSQVLFIS